RIPKSVAPAQFCETRKGLVRRSLLDGGRYRARSDRARKQAPMDSSQEARGGLVVIDIAKETLITIRAAGKLLPPSRLKKPVSPGCVMRWVHRGAKTPNGRVYLEALRIGGKWVTSVEALQRFAEAQTPSFSDAEDQVTRSPGQRQRGHEASA